MEDLKKEVPKLIDYNEAAHKRAFQIIQSFASKVEKFKVDYETLAKEISLDAFSPELLQEVITYGRTAIEKHIDKIVLTKDKPLQRHYKESFYKDLQKLDSSLIRISKGLHGDIPNVLRQISVLPWNGNSITPTEAYFKAIRRHFEVWIVSKDEKEVYKRLVAIETAYNSFFSFADEQGIRVPAGFTGLFGPYFGTAPREVKANPWLIFPLRNNSFESYENY
jgi:hypothetical protein